MTKEKAIEIIERYKITDPASLYELDTNLACDMAIRALEEQQPREPMQLKYSETREEYWFYESICPKCRNRWISNGIDHFCPACGQPVFEPCEEEQKDGEQE